MPVSNGFGRRLRYLVWDNHNNKLIGIIAIGDPVFNLSVRDNLIDWDAPARGERLVNIMDAYVLGALPPYNALLGGKLVACLLRSRDIYDDFAKAYGKTTGIISTGEKGASSGVTTSSSMGRSSVYNRLKLGGIEYFKSIGYTGGWGHFHIPDSLFQTFASIFAKSVTLTRIYTASVKGLIGACGPQGCAAAWVSKMTCSGTASSARYSFASLLITR